MRNAAIIVAAGQGTRMGPQTDKMFLELLGCPVVGHTWRQFDSEPGIDELVLVIRPERESHFEQLAHRLNVIKPYRLVHGGAERQDSVWNGLAALGEDVELVAIQDGARPRTPPGLIRKTLEAARACGAAVAAQRVTDTIKESGDGQTIARHLDRACLWSVQTPQCFRLPVIRQALEAVRRSGLRITDDTAACDLIGQSVRLVESGEVNPKLTTPHDVPYLELLLRGRGAALPLD